MVHEISIAADGKQLQRRQEGSIAGNGILDGFAVPADRLFWFFTQIALARVKPKDKDSGDVERFRLRQVTNRDGRAVALDRLTLRLQTLPRREGYWLDTGMLKTG